MLKEFSWNLFERTGNIDSYILFKQLGSDDISTGQKAGRNETAAKQKLPEVDAV